MSRPSASDIAKAKSVLRDDRKAKKALKLTSFSARPFPKREKATHGRERDVGYLAWLHQDLPCVACLVLGPAPADSDHIEASHQKINAASRGVFKRLGVRPSDWLCLPICKGHHRTSTPCCDPAQARFWCVVGLGPEEVADFCKALYRAYEQESDGAQVVRDFASLATGNRVAA
jgi:hypothetical protein